jgi:chromosome segregation ATPase
MVSARPQEGEASVTGAAQLAGETASQYVDRLECELDRAEERIRKLEADASAGAEQLESVLRSLEADVVERDFLRDQLTELSQQIYSASSPRTKRQMQRLLAGLLAGQDWRHGTWR